MKKIKLFFPAIALMLGLGLFITQSAFKPKTATLTYRFDGSTAGDLTSPGAWVPISEEEEPQGCEGSGLPCTVQFDSGDFSDIDAFIDHYETPMAVNGATEVQTRRD